MVDLIIYTPGFIHCNIEYTVQPKEKNFAKPIVLQKHAFHGIYFHQYSKGHHALAATINMGEKNSRVKIYANDISPTGSSPSNFLMICIGVVLNDTESRW